MKKNLCLLITILLLLTNLPTTQAQQKGTFYRIAEMDHYYVSDGRRLNFCTTVLSWHKNEGADYDFFKLIAARPFGKYAYRNGDYPIPNRSDTLPYYYPVPFDSILEIREIYDTTLRVMTRSGDKLLSYMERSTRSNIFDHHFYNYDITGNVIRIMSYRDNDRSLKKTDSFDYDVAQRLIRHHSELIFEDGRKHIRTIQNNYDDETGTKKNMTAEQSIMNTVRMWGQTIYRIRPGVDSIVTIPAKNQVRQQINYTSNGEIDSVHSYGFVITGSDTTYQAPLYIVYERNKDASISRILYRGINANREVDFQYSATQKLTSVMVYTINGGHKTPAHKEVLEYDRNDNLKSYITYSVYNQADNIWLQDYGDLVCHLTYELHEWQEDNKKQQKKSFFDILPYPNPASQDITIDLGDWIFDKIEIYDLSGRLVLLHTTTVPVFSHKTIDISRLAAGTYVVKVHTGQGIGIGKFVKIW